MILRSLLTITQWLLLTPATFAFTPSRHSRSTSTLCGGPFVHRTTTSTISSGLVSPTTEAAEEDILNHRNLAAVSRRDIFRRVVSVGIASSSGIAPRIAAAEAPETAAPEEDIDVYFGCGCFWHVQHEFVEAERKYLGRTVPTARSGYAGGRFGSDQAGRVCYHNAAMVADYGSLGHAEVVRLRIPPSSFRDFALEYCKLFDDKGRRPDQYGDRGPEYRNVVGLPGGAKSQYAKILVDVSSSSKGGDKLDFAVGYGNDSDKVAVAYVMDTDKFPFYVAERYHQFHDGFNIGENYPSKYNDLANSLAKDGILEKSACPNGMLGIGALGL